MVQGRIGPNHQQDSGFSLLEVLIVIALAVVTMAIGSGYYEQARNTIQGDANMRIVNWQLKLARERAINERRSIQVDFIQPNIIRLTRLEIPNGTTVLQTAYLENQTRFLLFAGQPDTPDGFGRATATWFGGAASVMFTPDGMLTDGAGNPVNGTVSLGQVGRVMTSRAVTIFGPTATLRTYRWNGSAWRR
jgi:prepilin-type N-terminal cleavage/methylation domain-containing protein